MDDMTEREGRDKMIKTVLGSTNAPGITLAHEHIYCYSEYAYRMAGADYLDKAALERVACAYLKELREKHGLTTFVDCTPVNIGRDVELLKRVSEQTEIDIVCATGFYFTDEPVLYNTPAELICKYMVSDAVAVNAGLIKCAVEQETVSDFQAKILRACAQAHQQLGLPIVLHTDALNQNAEQALEILFSENVKPEAVTVGHLSDTEDLEFVKKLPPTDALSGLTACAARFPMNTLQENCTVYGNFAKRDMRTRSCCPTMRCSLTDLKLSRKSTLSRNMPFVLKRSCLNCPSRWWKSSWYTTLRGPCP